MKDRQSNINNKRKIEWHGGKLDKWMVFPSEESKLSSKHCGV